MGIRNDIDQPLWDEEELAERIMVELTDSSGHMLRFRYVMALEHDGAFYAVLADSEQRSEAEEKLALLRIEPGLESGQRRYMMVDDPGEISAVLEQYVALTLRNTLTEMDGADFDAWEPCGCGMEGCAGNCDQGPNVLH